MLGEKVIDVRFLPTRSFNGGLETDEVEKGGSRDYYSFVKKQLKLRSCVRRDGESFDL